MISGQTQPHFIGKEQLKASAKTKQTQFSQFEKKLLSKYMPYEYGQKQIDIGNRLMMVEINQKMFDFVIKADYGMANVLSGGNPGQMNGFVAARLKRLIPIIKGIGFNLPKEMGIRPESVYGLRAYGEGVLLATLYICEVEFRSRILKPDDARAKDTFDPRALASVNGILEKHFGETPAVLLIGSFLKNEGTPSDIDLRIILKHYDLHDYLKYINLAKELKASSRYPPTYMLLQEDSSRLFWPSNTDDNPFDHSSSLLLNKPHEFWFMPEEQKAVFRVSRAIQKLYELRKALANFQQYSTFAQLKSKLNAPYYMLKLFTEAYGKTDLQVQKFKAGALGSTTVLDALVDANLVAQQVVEAFHNQLETT